MIAPDLNVLILLIITVIDVINPSMGFSRCMLLLIKSTVTFESLSLRRKNTMTARCSSLLSRGLVRRELRFYMGIGDMIVRKIIAIYSERKMVCLLFDRKICSNPLNNVAGSFVLRFERYSTMVNTSNATKLKLFLALSSENTQVRYDHAALNLKEKNCI